MDDEPSVRRAAARLLDAIGCTVESVATGAEALACATDRARHFDVLVTDFRMPGMSGADLIDAVERAGERLPVVLISGHLDDVRADARVPERVVLLPKPFTRASLADAISAAVGLARLPDGAPRGHT